MRRRLSPVAIQLASAFGGLAVAMAFPATALAQGGGAQQLDRVEVTGSILKRIEGEAALPVQRISVEELQQAGVTNAEQALRLVTQGGLDAVSSGSVSAGNGGASYASLRNLGPQRTLVLLNGKRVVSNPFAAVAVDLNTMPLAALDRIEVLSDGASSIYGTDAIGGVVNFITRKSYKGVTVAAEAQIPEAGDGEIYTANVLAGFGDLARNGWNIYGGFNYRQQQSMLGTGRDFMKTAYIPSRGLNALSPTTFPANYSQVVNGVTVVPSTNPTYPNCLPPRSISTPEPPPLGLTGNICGADTQGFTTVFPNQDQWSAILRGSLGLGANHTATLEYFFARNKINRTIAPSPEGGLTMGPDSPFYPGNGITPLTNPNLNPTQPISVSWRTVVLGARENTTDNDTQRVLASLEGSTAGWDYQANALWSKSEISVDYINGYGAISALRNGMRGINSAPFLNPFGDQTAAGLAFLEANEITGKLQRGEGKMSSLGLVASRQFGNLPGGPMGIGISAEVRKEEMLFLTDVARASQTTSSGIAGSAPRREGDRDIWAVALEMSFPVMKNLELGASVRYDHYSDFGSTTNPKFSFKYNVAPNLLLRGSYNTGFAAPTLTQLYIPNQSTFTGSRYNDPVLCPGGVVNASAGGIASRDCNIQFQQLQGGNRDLTPEKSRAWTAGFVAQPTPQLSFGIDYFYYKVENNIGVIGDPAIFADPVRYASLFVRCSQADPARIPTIPGCNVPGGDPLAYVLNTNLNLGNTKTNGIDLQLNWNPGATPYGRFTLNWRGTYINRYEFQVEPNGRWFDPLGNYNPRYTNFDGGSPGPVFRYKQVINLGWEMNALNAGLVYRYTSGYKDSNAGIPAPFNDSTVGAYHIFDLSFGYTGIKGLNLRAGVLNVFDTDPPFTNQTARFQARGYDDRFHNPLGRTWTLSARYEF